MKRIYILLLLCIYSTADALTLDDAINKALRAYPDILIKEREMQSRSLDVRISGGDFLPQLTFTSSYSAADSDKTRATDTFTNELRLNYNLFSGFYSYNSYNISKLSLKVAENTLTLTSKLIKKNVISAYYNALANYNLMKYYEEIYNSSLKTYEFTKSKYDVGRALYIDVLKSLTDLKKSETNLVEQRNMYINSLVALSQYTDEDYDNNTVIETDFFTPEIKPSHLYYLDMAQKNNLDLRNAMEQIKISEREIKRSKSTFMPSVDLYSAAYKENYDSGYSDTNSNNLTAGVSLTWNLFNGNKDIFNVGKMKLAYYNSIDEKRKIILTLKEQITSLYNQITSEKERLNYLKELVDVTKENYRLTIEAYELGRATLIELLKAKDEYTTANIDYVNIKNSLIQNYISLQYYIGE